MVGTLPIVYLGFPLGTYSKDKAIWNPVLERVENQLDSWKGGKMTLIKSVLTSLSVYFLSLFSTPRFVTDRLKGL